MNLDPDFFLHLLFTIFTQPFFSVLHFNYSLVDFVIKRFCSIQVKNNTKFLYNTNHISAEIHGYNDNFSQGPEVRKGLEKN